VQQGNSAKRKDVESQKDSEGTGQCMRMLEVNESALAMNKIDAGSVIAGYHVCFFATIIAVIGS
jgi:hypothetical protein